MVKVPFGSGLDAGRQWLAENALSPPPLRGKPTTHNMSDYGDNCKECGMTAEDIVDHNVADCPVVVMRDRIYDVVCGKVVSDKWHDRGGNFSIEVINGRLAIRTKDGGLDLGDIRHTNFHDAACAAHRFVADHQRSTVDAPKPETYAAAAESLIDMLIDGCGSTYGLDVQRMPDGTSAYSNYLERAVCTTFTPDHEPEVLQVVYTSFRSAGASQAEGSMRLVADIEKYILGVIGCPSEHDLSAESFFFSWRVRPTIKPADQLGEWVGYARIGATWGARKFAPCPAAAVNALPSPQLEMREFRPFDDEHAGIKILVCHHCGKRNPENVFCDCPSGCAVAKSFDDAHKRTCKNFLTLGFHARRAASEQTCVFCGDREEAIAARGEKMCTGPGQVLAEAFSEKMFEDACERIVGELVRLPNGMIGSRRELNAYFDDFKARHRAEKRAENGDRLAAPTIALMERHGTALADKVSIVGTTGTAKAAASPPACKLLPGS